MVVTVSNKTRHVLFIISMVCLGVAVLGVLAMMFFGHA
jgi:hypothetical protein